MQPYQNSNGSSNIESYEIGDNYLKVGFSNGDIYVYTNDSAGEEIVDQMKGMAQSGNGLNGFINKYAKNSYAEIE